MTLLANRKKKPNLINEAKNFKDKECMIKSSQIITLRGVFSNVIILSPLKT
ncbi:Hypothetical protein ETEE_3687 [Edwardsiella anguillarum ET080813]|uniref:Uncharacterized protein n=1 Tax=Edwardsiella anguillarum ET080813 TaxID=667120 RepID=A0A076LXE4_9GAMM|nr:Hypothetical protein ETEE_3687 [Edwardsiella anguillarum ET080813]